MGGRNVARCRAALCLVRLVLKSAEWPLVSALDRLPWAGFGRWRKSGVGHGRRRRRRRSNSALSVQCGDGRRLVAGPSRHVRGSRRRQKELIEHWALAGDELTPAGGQARADLAGICVVAEVPPATWSFPRDRGELRG